VIELKKGFTLPAGLSFFYCPGALYTFALSTIGADMTMGSAIMVSI